MNILTSIRANILSLQHFHGMRWTVKSNFAAHQDEFKTQSTFKKTHMRMEVLAAKVIISD